MSVSKSPRLPLIKVHEWVIVVIKEYLFVKETTSSKVMVTVRCLFDLLWVQLKKFSSFISWPPWLENQQSCIIKIGAEITLDEGQNHWFCDDKISSFRNRLVKICRISISRFFTDTKDQKPYYKKLWFFVC